MSIDRRSVLRAAAGSTASAALSTGCSEDGTPHTAVSPVGVTGASASAVAPAGSGTALPEQIINGPRDRPVVALTFHGQGDPRLATALFDEAERAEARLTVLAVGSWLDAYPGMAHRVLDGGHELGNHTQNHLDICHLPIEQAKAEITGCARRLRELTGRVGRWFRPSQARFATPPVRRLARSAGYPHVLSYDVDSLDFTDPGADAVRRAVLDGVRPGSIVSLHLGHPGTVEALPGVLDGLRARGLSAVTASDLLMV